MVLLKIILVLITIFLLGITIEVIRELVHKELHKNDWVSKDVKCKLLKSNQRKSEIIYLFEHDGNEYIVRLKKGIYKRIIFQMNF